MAVQLTPSHARWSFPAGAAGLAQYQFCALNASGQLIVPASSGIFAVVLDDAPSLAVSTIGTGNVVTGGYVVGTNYGTVLPTGSIMKVITGANLTVGTAITTDTSGHAVPALGSGIVLGYAIAASSSGDTANILFKV